MRTVYALADVSTFLDGVKVHVAKGSSWNGDDPFVKARPELFSDAPTDLVGTVEQATAAPGEQRAVKRPARKG